MSNEEYNKCVLGENAICKCGDSVPQIDYNNAYAIIKEGYGQDKLIYKTPFAWMEFLFYTNTVPDGTVIDWVSDGKPPIGWLECNGYVFSKDTYPDLYIILGGNQLPDFTGRIAVHNAPNSMYDGKFYHPVNSKIHDGNEDPKYATTKRVMTPANMPIHKHKVEDTYPYRWTRAVRKENHNEGEWKGTVTLHPATDSYGDGYADTSEGQQPWYHLQRCYTTRKLIRANPIINVNLHTLPTDPTGNITPPEFPPTDVPLSGDPSEYTPPENMFDFIDISGCYDYYSLSSVPFIETDTYDTYANITLSSIELLNGSLKDYLSATGISYIAFLNENANDKNNKFINNGNDPLRINCPTHSGDIYGSGDPPTLITSIGYMTVDDTTDLTNTLPNLRTIDKDKIEAEPVVYIRAESVAYETPSAGDTRWVMGSGYFGYDWVNALASTSITYSMNDANGETHHYLLGGSNLSEKTLIYNRDYKFSAFLTSSECPLDDTSLSSQDIWFDYYREYMDDGSLVREDKTTHPVLITDTFEYDGEKYIPMTLVGHN